MKGLTNGCSSCTLRMDILRLLLCMNCAPGRLFLPPSASLMACRWLFAILEFLVVAIEKKLIFQMVLSWVVEWLFCSVAVEAKSAKLGAKNMSFLPWWKSHHYAAASPGWSYKEWFSPNLHSLSALRQPHISFQIYCRLSCSISHTSRVFPHFSAFPVVHIRSPGICWWLLFSALMAVSAATCQRLSKCLPQCLP